MINRFAVGTRIRTVILDSAGVKSWLSVRDVWQLCGPLGMGNAYGDSSSPPTYSLPSTDLLPSINSSHTIVKVLNF